MVDTEDPIIQRRMAAYNSTVPPKLYKDVLSSILSACRKEPETSFRSGKVYKRYLKCK